MKICFFADAKSIHTERWCNHFHQLGHEIHVISFQPNEIPNTKVHWIDTGSINQEGGNWKVLFAFPKIRRLLKIIKPDIFHAHYATSYGISGALCGFHPYIITCLGTDILISPKESKIIRFLVRFAFKRSDLVTVVADHMVEHVLSLKVPSEKVVAIPFGINPEIFNASDKQLDENRFVILSTRNLETLYNIPHVIKSVAIVKKKIPQVFLKIIGFGALRPELEELVRSLNLENNVEFLGKVDQSEVVKQMKSSHAFVSVSTSDGNNISLNEAMACNTFSIATNIPANTQWIKHGENGFLVEINDVEGLAYYLIHVYEHFDELQKQAQPLNEAILNEKGIWQKNMAKMEHLYQNLLSKK